MSLSTDLIDQFIEATKDEPKPTGDSIVYGTVRKNGNAMYVQLDGSPLYTPVSTTTTAQDGERVAVLIKNHTATILGNFTSPSANAGSIGPIATDELIAKSALFEFLLADKAVAEDILAGRITAAKGEIAELTADKLTVEDLQARYANIENLESDFAKLGEANIGLAKIDDLNAIHVWVRHLEGDYAEFEEISVGDLIARNIDVSVLDAYAAYAKFANIDFANIDEAAINNFFAKSGIITNLTLEEGVVVKELVGVTIKGDLIEAGTLKVDRLVVKGSDGNYYKLSTDFAGMPGVEPVEEDMIHGSTIVARSIAAEKVAVSDLVAFGAKIAGFTITDDISVNDLTVFTSGMEVVEGGYYQERGPLYVCHLDGTPDSINDARHLLEVTLSDEEIDEEVLTNGLEIKVYTSGMQVAGGSFYVERTADMYRCVQNGAPESLDDTDYFTKEPYIGAIYSGVKSSVDNTTRGVYLDSMGQVAFGDIDNFVKFYRNPDSGSYELAINASKIILGSDKRDVEENISGAQGTADIAQGSADSAATVAGDAKALADSIDAILKGLSGTVDANTTLIQGLSDAIVTIQNCLSTLVIDGDDTTLLQQNGTSFTFNFAELNETVGSLSSSMSNALEHRGYIQFEKNDGDPYILISASTTGIKLKLTSTTIEFVNSSGEPFASIDADMDGRPGMSIDNETVTGELRQSNPAKTGEFVWQVRANGNYGLSWKG